MKPTIRSTSLVCAVLMLTSGCVTGPEIKRPDPKGLNTLDTMGMDERSWNEVEDVICNSLRDEFVGKFQPPPGKVALLAISKIRSDLVDFDRLVKRIRVTLLATGKIATLTTVGIGESEDPIAEEERRRARLLGLDVRRPDYTLSGKIIATKARANNTTEKRYVFLFSLTKNPDGFAVWEKEHIILKQSKRPIVDWDL